MERDARNGQPSVAPPTPEVQQAATDPSSLSDPPGPLVLLAEDDPEMRHLVAEALRDDGYQVVELVDGGRFLVNIAARVKAERGTAASVDLIVSDIRMPVCTGLQIVSALREAHWRTPVILMTAFGDEATHRHAASLDAVLFDKPFEMDDLRAAIARLLRDRAAR
jgi:DNA-binding response OmpR family regulator